jgi:hypothetical protein
MHKPTDHLFLKVQNIYYMIGNINNLIRIKLKIKLCKI